jgi:hypothetical protein
MTTSEDSDLTAAPLSEVVRAHGHEHVRAEHESTFEVTTDDWLTPAGDCILAIEADRAPASFDPAFREACRDGDATITAIIEVDEHVETVTGRGHPELTFGSERSLVCRTSTHVDDRTVMVEADAAAVNFDRDLVAALADGADLTLTLTVESVD